MRMGKDRVDAYNADISYRSPPRRHSPQRSRSRDRSKQSPSKSYSMMDLRPHHHHQSLNSYSVNDHNHMEDTRGRSYHMSDILSFGSVEPSSRRSHQGAPDDLAYDSDGGMSRGDRNRSSVRSTYSRIQDRRRKLAALRDGLDIEDGGYSDGVSLSDHSTDMGDRKSIISANSYTRGMYLLN